MINLFSWAATLNTRLPDDDEVEEVVPEDAGELRDHSKSQKIKKDHGCGSLPAYIKAEYDYLHCFPIKCWCVFISVDMSLHFLFTDPQTIFKERVKEHGTREDFGFFRHFSGTFLLCCFNICLNSFLASLGSPFTSLET